MYAQCLKQQGAYLGKVDELKVDELHTVPHASGLECISISVH